MWTSRPRRGLRLSNVSSRSLGGALPPACPSPHPIKLSPPTVSRTLHLSLKDTEGSPPTPKTLTCAATLFQSCIDRCMFVRWQHLQRVR
jgi:hypothetical protein